MRRTRGDGRGHGGALAEPEPEEFEEFRAQLADIEAAHWDLYWRCSAPGKKVLGEDEIRERLAQVRAASHVLADLRTGARGFSRTARRRLGGSARDDLPGPCLKDGRIPRGFWPGDGLVDLAPSGAFQIVQRRQSGWVNWGSNGENECPNFRRRRHQDRLRALCRECWRGVADQLETPPKVTVDVHQ